MLVTETVQREVHVEPCLECGGTDILISDQNYSSFNRGGGKCKTCGHEVSEGVGCLPTPKELVAIWNAANDIPALIRAEGHHIQAAQARIAELSAKQFARKPANP